MRIRNAKRKIKRNFWKNLGEGFLRESYCETMESIFPPFQQKKSFAKSNKMWYVLQSFNIF